MPDRRVALVHAIGDSRRSDGKADTVSGVDSDHWENSGHVVGQRTVERQIVRHEECYPYDGAHDIEIRIVKKPRPRLG
jgi:hypothetical protein